MSPVIGKWSSPFRDEPREHPPYDLIRYEKDPPLGRIILNSPEKRNPLGYERLLQVNMAVKEMELDEDINVIIIKGDGPCFSAGFDITPITPGQPARNQPASGVYIHPDRDGIWQSYELEHQRTYWAIWDLQKPVIAQIHGYCLAGGTMLSGFCDLRIVAEDAQIGWPVSRNWSPGNTQYIPWLIGITRAKFYMMTAWPMDGKKAYEWGWASAVFPPEKLEEETEKIAREMALVNTDLMMLTKRSINRQYEIAGFRTGCTQSVDYLALCGRRPRVLREGDQFRKVAAEKGLKAALDWRDKTFDISYRTSETAKKLKA